MKNSLNSTLLHNGLIVNEGERFRGSILIVDDKIEQITKEGEPLPTAQTTIECSGKVIIPGVIDDQVHFRYPGATHKGDIASESAAAVLGGVTSYMDMPNNNPPATTVESLEEKRSVATKESYANYSFYLGATNDNIEEIVAIDKNKWCGVKVFMGSSTGNMLVDNRETLKEIFEKCTIPIAVHSESEPIIVENLERAKKRWGEDIPVEEHPNIRSREACIETTKIALDLAKEHKSQLHLLHISTAEEVDMIAEGKKRNPKISAEACVHFMIFDSSDYSKLGTLIKCNPAIKERRDREAIIKGVKERVLEVVATDHAPHTLEEKEQNYLNAPSGLPLVQHSLQIMLSLEREGKFTLEEVIDRMCHAPAALFNIDKRGYIREGNFADIVILDRERKDNHSTEEPAYKCGWTPLQGVSFEDTIWETFVNGVRVVKEGKLTGEKGGERLTFNR